MLAVFGPEWQHVVIEWRCVEHRQAAKRCAATVAGNAASQRGVASSMTTPHRFGIFMRHEMGRGRTVFDDLVRFGHNVVAAR